MELGALQHVPMVKAGDCLADIIIRAAHRSSYVPQPGDALVVAQKVVSKAEGRLRLLADVEVTAAATALASEVDKDPRLVQLILDESRSIIRARPGVIIAEHKLGHILANAGIDASNIEQRTGSEQVLLWPEDPDASAERLSIALEAHYGFEFPVVINDSMGRAWRLGTVGHAIGCYGIDPLWSQVGEFDLMGNVLKVTEPATADALAAAAALLQGEAGEGQPIVYVRDCPVKTTDPRPATALLREVARDMFR